MIDLIGDILYEDNQVMVAVKPPNMLSQADRTGDPDILSVLKNYIRRTDGLCPDEQGGSTTGRPAPGA